MTTFQYQKLSEDYKQSGEGVISIEAFCLRMLSRKYFDVSNSWYAPALRVRK